MIDRHLTWIDGPAGSGKTTLIEQIVRSNRSKEILALRIRTDASIDAPVYAEADERSPEVGRWVAAGAWAAGTLRVPVDGTRDLFHALQECENVDHLYAANVWLVEGPVEHAGALHHTLVFVTPPLAEGQTAVFEEEREVARIDGMTALRMLAAHYAEEAGEGTADEPWPSTPPEDLPEGMRPGDIDEETGDEIVDAFEIPDELGWQIVKILEEGVPSKQRKHWLHDELEGIADAHVVVVNAARAGEPAAGRPAHAGASAGQRAAGAEDPSAGHAPDATASSAGPEAPAATPPADAGAAGRLVDELQALWRDETLRYEVLGTRLGRRTILAARLPDRRDDGTRKAVAAIKRRWRDTFDHPSRSSFWDDDEEWNEGPWDETL